MLTMSMSNPFVTSDNGYMHWPNQRNQGDFLTQYNLREERPIESNE
jgi:hypothetical protein